MFAFTGEIFILQLQGFNAVGVLHCVNSEPYDVFGAWLTERYYISGTFEFMENDSSTSELLANCADGFSQDYQTKLARVVNYNSSSVRTVLVARSSGMCSSRPAKGSSALQRNDCICLIFTHGTVTYVPHQIVFKWLKLENGDHATRKLSIVRNNHTNSSYVERGRKGEVGYEPCYTEEEHCIETNAHIIGMSLSPDHQFLYVNCRPWQQQDGKDRIAPRLIASPPEISSEITLRVYSLATYKLVGVHTGHEAYTPNDGCFFIFLNVADKFVAR